MGIAAFLACTATIYKLLLHAWLLVDAWAVVYSTGCWCVLLVMMHHFIMEVLLLILLSMQGWQASVFLVGGGAGGGTK